MKRIIRFSVLVLFIIFFSLSINSCHKDRAPVLPSNHPPVANAGNDITINLVSCNSVRSVVLDGSASYDPDVNTKIQFRWTKISGPPGVHITGSTEQHTTITNITAGQYAFQLQVIDEGGMYSKDTVIINVSGTTSPQEYNLDVSLSGKYNFIDDDVTCYDMGWGPLACNYYDVTDFSGVLNLPSLGLGSFQIHEETDTAAAVLEHDTQLSLSFNEAPSKNVWGGCSINFKKLIQQGGGPFSGTWKLDEGTAKGCDENIFVNLAPLALSGIIDTTSHTISLNVKGKVYF